MSRGKFRSATEVCADCGGHSDPTWASINRGILLCDECCSVHRSLGRHVSQVKSLKKDAWSPSQLAMVHALCSSGANNIWEHTLLDPTNAKNGRRKPNPKDPLNPTKADFIRAKHQMLAFVFRPNKEDSQLDSDLSKQLHSSVRTANVETSLRLLSLGADPNFFHTEKGTRPIHVAAKAGQDSQVELLTCYGADPGAYDWEGNTPVQYARSAGHLVLADRLVELQYELTDRLAYFVSNRKPDHLSGQHFIIPEMADSLEGSEVSKAAKRKLQILSDSLFEDLVMDIYDEVDRRHTDEIWLTCGNHSTMVVDRCNVPFLPVNPEYSSTRNQGRQKLARFNTRELTILIIDILSEAKRRQLGISLNNTVTGRQFLKPTNVLEANESDRVAVSDDDPLYDSVASDDECPPAIPRSVPQQDRSAVVLASHATATPTETVNKHLALAEARIQQLLDSNKGMRNEISDLKSVVQRLIHENSSLRSQVQSVMVSNMSNGSETQKSSPRWSGVGEVGHKSSKINQRPQSMYEARDQVRHKEVGGEKQNSHSFRKSNESNPNAHYPSTDFSQCAQDHWNGNTQKQSVNLEGWTRSNSLAFSDSSSSIPLYNLPTQNEALHKSRPITKRIQELHVLAREQKYESYINCAEKIHAAVLEMAGLFPENLADQKVQTALTELTNSALRLHTQTKKLANPRNQQMDHSFIAQEIVRYAYDTTKAIKGLVTLLD